MEYFKQKIKAGEVGSSAMPHKVNPVSYTHLIVRQRLCVGAEDENLVVQAGVLQIHSSSKKYSTAFTSWFVTLSMSLMRCASASEKLR